ncbi:hypothetical protein A33Q_2115 [Indibacter alkaliphilus LW1]|uniref:Uncharacterized protein n=1 Tax=Indibacter alkaliphilus (strain CCUG 57479 / KCTC 22604 / LW1) TaxID=1189612 RepID=S2DHY9_INDAL|nr:hypothetical protein A33Q_2115 [Indibacter alkaliphilus LW1]
MKVVRNTINTKSRFVVKLNLGTSSALNNKKATTNVGISKG